MKPETTCCICGAVLANRKCLSCQHEQCQMCPRFVDRKSYEALEADNKALLDALKLCDIESQVANGHIGTPAYLKIRAAIEHSEPQ